MDRLRILVVDDDPSQCALVSRLLSRRHYSVDVAGNGPAALELAERQAYRLAVIDFQMPRMNGVELFRRLRELQPELMGVFLTGFPNIDTVYPAIEAGIERVLAKPVNDAELFAVVEELAGHPV